MKHLAKIAAAVLLISTSALAYDLTYCGPIKSKETKTVQVELPTGVIALTVFSSDADTTFKCQFSTSYGGPVFEQVNVKACVTSINMESASSMKVAVTNLSSKDSDYKIWVHDSK